MRKLEIGEYNFILYFICILNYGNYIESAQVLTYWLDLSSKTRGRSLTFFFSIHLSTTYFLPYLDWYLTVCIENFFVTRKYTDEIELLNTNKRDFANELCTWSTNFIRFCPIIERIFKANFLKHFSKLIFSVSVRWLRWYTRTYVCIRFHFINLI